MNKPEHQSETECVGPENDRDVVISRDFDAPARVLFEAFRNPAYLKRWFGPKGWPLTTCDMDFRVGGRYRFQMTGPGGQTTAPFGGQFLEIVEDRKIVYDNTFEAPRAETMIVTITYEEFDGRTTMTIHTRFATMGMKKAHVDGGFVQGVGSGLDQLADLAMEMMEKERK